MDWEKKIRNHRPDVFIGLVKNTTWTNDEKWPDPEHDDVLRAFCTLYDAQYDDGIMEKMAENMLNGQLGEFESIDQFKKGMASALVNYVEANPDKEFSEIEKAAYNKVHPLTVEAEQNLQQENEKAVENNENEINNNNDNRENNEEIENDNNNNNNENSRNNNNNRNNNRNNNNK